MWKPLLLVLFLSACSSSDKQQGFNPLVHPAAYSVDGFNVFPPAPEHEDKPKSKFYFKECDPSGGRTYYSHTSYICDEI